MRRGIENWRAIETASSNSRRGKLGESAKTASDLSPSALCATCARKTESTPPEYATRHEPYERKIVSSSWSLFTDTPQFATEPPNFQSGIRKVGEQSTPATLF